MGRTLRGRRGADGAGGEGRTAGSEVRRRFRPFLARAWALACSGLLLAACAGGKPVTQRELDLALVRAAEAGDIVEVKRLLRAGADIDAADPEGWTPYLAASSNGRLETMRLLKALGARTHVIEDEGPPLAPSL